MLARVEEQAVHVGPAARPAEISEQAAQRRNPSVPWRQQLYVLGGEQGATDPSFVLRSNPSLPSHSLQQGERLLQQVCPMYRPPASLGTRLFW